MHNTPRILSKGIHTLALPLNTSLPIGEIFPREISGSYIEAMDETGKFINKSLILYENGLFLVDTTFQVLKPMQVIRLYLTREITLFWDVNIHFYSHTQLKKEVLPYSVGYDKEKSLYLMQLCHLVYENEDTIKEILEENYDFSNIFYFSKATAHKRLIHKNRLNLIYLFLKSRTTLVDLQFMKLIHYDKVQKKHIILLVFKGSSKAEDWVTNLTFSNVQFLGKTNTQVHRGFQAALRLFIKTIKQSCFELNGQEYTLEEATLPLLNNSIKIICTGHSLGGAVATLAACYFHDKGFKSEDIEVYTYGAPPVASQNFVNYFRGKFAVYRIVNEMDVVPRLDHLNLNLFHLGKKITLPSNDQEIHTSSGYIDNLLDALGNEEV
ncbi:MAG: lipase family protein [Thiotrichaceae bacterium]|nr:lipase family protein [Thiotrichaceae bacterium]